MRKNLFRLGIILILVLIVTALILSGRFSSSEASSTTLNNGDYLRDNWVYGYPVAGGVGATGGEATSAKKRFQKISNLTNFDLNIEPNAVVRIDTTPGLTNTFNGITIGEGATLTHTPMGMNFADSRIMKGYVSENDYFAVRWTGWIYLPPDMERFVADVDNGIEIYVSNTTGVSNEDALVRNPLVKSGGGGVDSWGLGGGENFLSGSFFPTDAIYRITINYFEWDNLSKVKLQWKRGGINEVIPQKYLYSQYPSGASAIGEPAIPGTGLNADYYVYNPNPPNADLWDEAERPIFKVKNYRYTRIDPTINFDWGIGTPFMKIDGSKKLVITDKSIEDRDNGSYKGGFSGMAINAKSIYLQQNAKISVNGAGFPGGTMWTGSPNDNSVSYNGFGPGGGLSTWTGEENTGGASYCGKGESADPALSGVIYGVAQSTRPDTALPTPIGSGGSNASNGGFAGTGGGFISIAAEDLVMGDYSQIIAEGGSASGDSSEVSGGSGGTIYIAASNSFIQGAGTKISVDGGYDRVNRYGGAGRVAFYYPNASAIPQNVSASGRDRAGDCTPVLALYGTSATGGGSTLSITKAIEPATATAGSEITIILSIYNPTDSPQVVNIKDDKFLSWDTYPNLVSDLGIVTGLDYSDAEIANGTINFNNVTVPGGSAPGVIKYKLTVPNNP